LHEFGPSPASSPLISTPVPGEAVGGAEEGGDPVRVGGAANAGIEVNNNANALSMLTSTLMSEGRRDEPDKPII